MPGKSACPRWPGSSFSSATGMITLIILFGSRVNTATQPSIVLTKAVFLGALPPFDSSLEILSGICRWESNEGGWGGGIKAACAAVDEGGHFAGGWLLVSRVTRREAKDPHRRDETIIISGWSLVQYVDFVFGLRMSSVIINV